MNNNCRLTERIKYPLLKNPKLLRAIVLVNLALPVFTGAITQATNVSSEKFSAEIRKILKSSELKHTKVGIKVISLVNNDALFEQNANTPLVPASNAKIITSIAALTAMRPSYKFKTDILTDGKIKDGVLNGNLYIRGTGDTFFVTEQIYFLANELAREGFTRVTKDLIIDDFYFDQDYNVPSGDRAFVAPVGAVSVNFNSIAIYIRPGKKVGDPAIIYLDPPNEFVSLVNNAKTVSTGKKNAITVQRVVSSAALNKIEVSGKISLDSTEVKHYRSISNPPMYAGAVIKSILGHRGITIAGKIGHKKTPSSARVLLQYDSKPMAQITKDLLNFSNNMIADQLTKALGAFKSGPPGSTGKGLNAINKIASSMGIDGKHFRLADGSGLDRRTRITADQFLIALQHAYKDPELFPVFWFGMTVAGVEGTLKNRFHKTAAIGKLRAKTGSLAGVSSLVGFAPSADGELLAFAIIMNDSSGKSVELHRVQDQIGDLLCRFTRHQ